MVVAAGYPLAARADRPLPVRDLLDQPLLLREPGSGTRETFLSAAQLGAGGQAMPAHIVELGSTATIVATALAGGGIGVVSARAVAHEIAAGSLTELRVAGVDLRRPLHAVWLKGRPAPLAGELIEIARRSS